MQGLSRHTWLWTVVVAFVFVLDRIAKLAAVLFWSQRPYHLAPGVDFSFLLNKGIALSLPVPPWLFYGIAAPALLFIIVQGVRAYRRQDRRMALVLALLFAGAASNILDRILYDGVVDYISFLGRSVVNLADGMIVVAVLMLVMAGSSKRRGQTAPAG